MMIWLSKRTVNEVRVIIQGRINLCLENRDKDEVKRYKKLLEKFPEPK